MTPGEKYLTPETPASSCSNMLIIANKSEIGMSDQLITVDAAADRLGVHRSFLDRRRVAGGGPIFIKLSARKVLYRVEELDRWAAAHARTSTSDAGVVA